MGSTKHVKTVVAIEIGFTHLQKKRPEDRGEEDATLRRCISTQLKDISEWAYLKPPQGSGLKVDSEGLCTPSLDLAHPNNSKAVVLAVVPGAFEPHVIESRLRRALDAAAVFSEISGHSKVLPKLGGLADCNSLQVDSELPLENLHAEIHRLAAQSSGQVAFDFAENGRRAIGMSMR